MRYLESIARICEQSDSRMEYAIGNKVAQLVSFLLDVERGKESRLTYCYFILHQILDCLKSDDPLFLMNVVDLVPSLSKTRLGIQYIFQSGTLRSASLRSKTYDCHLQT